MLCSRTITLCCMLVASASNIKAQSINVAVRGDGGRTIAVEGFAPESVTPDLALVSVGVETHSLTAGDTLAANGKEMIAVIDVLKTHGIAPKDIQTSDVRLKSVHEKPTVKPDPENEVDPVL